MGNPGTKTRHHFPTIPRANHGKSDASSTGDEFGISVRACVSSVAIYGTKPDSFNTWLVWILSLSWIGKLLLQESAMALLFFGIFLFKHLSNSRQVERHYMYLKAVVYFSVWKKYMGKLLLPSKLKHDDCFFASFWFGFFCGRHQAVKMKVLFPFQHIPHYCFKKTLFFSLWNMCLAPLVLERV